MRILFAGTTQHAARVLRHLANSIHEIVGVITREDAPVGRKSILTESPVAEVARELGMTVIKVNKPDSSTDEWIGSLSADVGVVIAYGSLLKPTTLASTRSGWFNIHYSLLPHWRGAAPVQRSILAGDKITGVTIFQLEAGMDDGPIASQVPTEISPDENSGELLDRLTNIGISALDEVLASLAAESLKLVAQVGAPTLAAKITKTDAEISWHENASTISNLVRAMNPEPVAWTKCKDEHFRILSARTYNMSDSISHCRDGEVLSHNHRVLVRCGQESYLELITVQPAGKSVMSAADWYRGKGIGVIFNG